LCDWSVLYVFVARRVRDREPCVRRGGGREEKSKMDGSFDWWMASEALAWYL
jgi:hypothetical protein